MSASTATQNPGPRTWSDDLRQTRGPIYGIKRPQVKSRPLQGGGSFDRERWEYTRATTIVGSDRGSPTGHFWLFGSKAFYGSCCSGDLAPGSLCPACRAAYCSTRFSDRFPSRTAYLARRSAADPPGLTSRSTTRSFCTTLCPSCLPLFTGHVFLLDDDVATPTYGSIATMNGTD
jgi:hypothetical protein